MPRGKYPRRSAAVEAAKSQPAPAAADVELAAPVEAQPSIDPALLEDAAQVVTQAAKVAEVAISNARRPHRFADHAKSRDIGSLSGAALRDYAREVGMSRRDCAELSEDRLRAGCRAHLARHFDELTE